MTPMTPFERARAGLDVTMACNEEGNPEPHVHCRGVVRWNGAVVGKCACQCHAAVPEERPSESKCSGYCVGTAKVETLVEDLACPVHGIDAQERAALVFPDRQAWLDSLAAAPEERE